MTKVKAKGNVQYIVVLTTNKSCKHVKLPKIITLGHATVLGIIETMNLAMVKFNEREKKIK